MRASRFLLFTNLLSRNSQEKAAAVHVIESDTTESNNQLVIG